MLKADQIASLLRDGMEGKDQDPFLITPTPKQRHGIECQNAKVKGKKGGGRSKRDLALQDVINNIVLKIKSDGVDPSASNVWRYLMESADSYSPTK